MTLRTRILSTACFTSAAVLSAFVAGGSATVIEMRSQRAMQVEMETAGHSWVDVRTDGLQVILLGSAPSEAERFRAITRAGMIVDSSRIVDNTDVISRETIAPPEFSLEMLRNDDGLSLIGLIPAATDRSALVESLRAQAGIGTVTDLLETADYPAPDGWAQALDFAIETIRTQPRAKISVDPGQVKIHALADSPAEKTRIETNLARRRPDALKVIADISAPRPVITPFTLRFLIDAEGARFDACSADTERARDRILSAARAAGAQGAQGCTIGMGTPSPQWSDAVAMGLKALADLGAGTITFADGDVVLVAAETVPQGQYDKIVGELESNLPEVFSLKAERRIPPQATTDVPEFSALLAQDGHVELRGRVTDDRAREAVENLARARFGATAVYGATRVDGDLPQGWPVRTMAALEALDLLVSGSVTVTPDMVRVTGLSGDPQASDNVSRLLAGRLGEAAPITLAIRYDRRLDPVLGLPTGAECVDRLNGVLASQKITFEPGSAVISTEGARTMDALAAAMKDCQDFRMEIGGHTDSQGRDEMNLALSQDRAQSVLAALQGRRLLTGNLVATGYGETQPIADNGTEEGREANRRIEFVLLDAAPIPDAAEPAPAEPAPGADTPGTAGPVPDANTPAVAEPVPDADTPAVAEPAPDAVPEAADTPDGPPMDEPAPDTTDAPVEAPVTAPANGAAETPADVPPGTLPEQDPAIEIPVAPGTDSPARPDPRPEDLAAPN